MAGQTDTPGGDEQRQRISLKRGHSHGEIQRDPRSSFNRLANRGPCWKDQSNHGPADEIDHLPNGVLIVTQNQVR